MSPLKLPPVGGTRALLQSLLPSLVPSERRVVQVCIDKPDQVVGMSVAEVAEQADVSPATVVRACQRLGFEGFLQLRELPMRDEFARSAGKESTEPAVEQEPKPIVEQFFERAIDGLHGALGALDLAAFDLAAKRIRECSRLLAVGNGASLPAAQSVGLQFLMSGKVCESPVDIVSQQVAANLLKPGDVCLAVSESGINRFTVQAAEIAARNGATVIAITSYGRSELAQIAELSLVAGAEFHGWKDQPITGNIVQLLLLSALHAVSLGEEPDAIEARKASLAETSKMAVNIE